MHRASKRNLRLLPTDGKWQQMSRVDFILDLIGRKGEFLPLVVYKDYGIALVRQKDKGTD